jgi:hypothetical protein
MVVALATVAFRSPTFLTDAFNPVSLNLAVAALAFVGLAVGKYVPTASQCRRRPRGKADL